MRLKKEQQSFWGASLAGTKGYTAIFKLESLLRLYEEKRSVISKCDLQTPSKELWARQSLPGYEEQQVLNSEVFRVPGNPRQVHVTLLEISVHPYPSED